MSVNSSSEKVLTVKPIHLKSVSEMSEPPGRIQSLSRLCATKLANIYYSQGFHKETRHSSHLPVLRDYFSCLPSTVQDAVFLAIRSLEETRMQQNFSFLIHQEQNPGFDCGYLAYYLFRRKAESLELKEFIGKSGSMHIFKSIVEDERKEDYEHVREVHMASCDIGAERLSYLYEVTEQEWKPDLKVFLTNLSNLTRLSLSTFCDDDVLCLVGQVCSKLESLKMKLSPDSFSEQQLTDDGFEEFTRLQAKQPSLKLLDLSECLSSSITSRTVLALHRLTSLCTLRLRSSHFSWLDLTLKMNRDHIQPNPSVKQLTLNLVLNNCEKTGAGSLHPTADLMHNVIFLHLNLLFPELDVIRLHGMHVINSLFTGFKNEDWLQEKIKEVRVIGCRGLQELSDSFPKLEEVTFSYVRLLSHEASFPHLKVLKIINNDSRDTLLYNDFRVMLHAVSALKELHMSGVSIKRRNDPGSLPERRLVTEKEFIDVFASAPHLAKLEVIALNFSQDCLLTIDCMVFLLKFCQNLKFLGNMLSWRITIEDVDFPKLERDYGMAVRCAYHSHWSLPWRGDDGSFHDSTRPEDHF